jgi:hypothetical protein
LRQALRIALQIEGNTVNYAVLDVGEFVAKMGIQAAIPEAATYPA